MARTRTTTESPTTERDSSAPGDGSARGGSSEPAGEISDRLHAFLDSTLDHLDEQQAVLSRRVKALNKSPREGFDPHLAQAGAALARARSTAVAELRKLEKHDRTQAKNPAEQWRLIKSWIMSQATAAQRQELAALLAKLAEQRSVLS